MVAATSEQSMMGHNRPPIEEVLTDQYRDLGTEIEAIADRANNTSRKIESDADLGPIGDLVVDASKLAKKIEAARKFEKEPHDAAGKAVQAYFLPLIDRVRRIADAFEDLATKYQREKAAAARRAAEDEARKLREAEEKKRQEAEAAKRQVTADKKIDQAEELADRAEEAEAKAQASNAELTKVRTDSGVTAGTKTIWSFQITDYDAIPLEKLRPFLKREHVESAIRSLVNIQKGSTSLEGVRVFEDIKSTFRR